MYCLRHELPRRLALERIFFLKYQQTLYKKPASAGFLFPKARGLPPLLTRRAAQQQADKGNLVFEPCKGEL